MKSTLLIIIPLLLLLGCAQPEPVGETLADFVVKPTMLFNITSSPIDDPHAVTMALQLAGHALDDGRPVVLFFNVRGVTTATVTLPDDLAFHVEPIKTLLANLVDRGAEVQVCPHCMEALGVQASDLIAGAVVTDRETLFAKVTANTVVFSY
jgi:sulfur relay (sulfurtransferase) complex TusBCD TusD component (DsrE family)